MYVIPAYLITYVCSVSVYVTQYTITCVTCSTRNLPCRIRYININPVVHRDYPAHSNISLNCKYTTQTSPPRDNNATRENVGVYKIFKIYGRFL